MSAIFGFTDHEANYQRITPFLLFLKARENCRLDIKSFKKKDKVIIISTKKPQKRENCERKWKRLLEKKQKIYFKMYSGATDVKN